MRTVLQIDWKSVFVPSFHLAEIFLRGTIVYVIFLVLRLLRREAGALSISDLLVVVLIADAAQNAMASEYRSITEGLVLITTIAFWDYFLEWLGYRFPSVDRLTRPAPLLLIKDGRFQRRHMKQEMITEEELMGLLREQGLEAANKVKKCYFGRDGHVSIVKMASKDTEGRERKVSH